MHIDELVKDPFLAFKHFMKEAKLSEENDPNSFSLATADMHCKPSVRTLLFKGIIEHDNHPVFSFYSNTCSAKGQEISSNPQAEMLFYWPKCYRQVRIAGSVVTLSREQSVQYFHSRSVMSQYSCVASTQSERIGGREVLEQRVAELIKHYPGGEGLSCPDTWQGYGLLPLSMEFWIGRDHRLHDRFLFVRKNPAEAWQISRLSP